MSFFNPQRKPTGLCPACGRATKLLVHQKCGEKLRKKRAEAGVAEAPSAPRKLSRKAVTYLGKKFSDV
jgi:hypothetical protein